MRTNGSHACVAFRFGHDGPSAAIGAARSPAIPIRCGAQGAGHTPANGTLAHDWNRAPRHEYGRG